MDNPKVSIVVPAYNAERFIESTLNSVLAQNFSSWEMIVVNDGSTDHTQEIVEAYTQRDARIRVVTHEVTRERSAARNSGLRLAVGDYIAFLDADDCWLPSKLAEQLDCFANFPEIKATFTGIEIIDEDGNIVETWSQIHKKYPDSCVNRSLLIEKGNVVSGSASTVMICRSLLDAVGYFDESMNAAEDLDYWYRIACHSTLVRLPKNLAQIRWHGASQPVNLVNLNIGKLVFIQKARRDLPPELLPPLRDFEIRTLYSLVASYWYSRNVKRSIVLFIQLFNKYPWETVMQVYGTALRKIYFRGKQR